MKILIADDDRVQTLMLSTRLEEKGFTVLAAYDALQAWMSVIKSQPDAVILDIQMPGGTGVAVLRQLKASSKTFHIPVVVVSGSIDTNAAALVKGLGADEYLAKPVDLERLYQALSSLLGTPPKSCEGNPNAT